MTKPIEIPEWRAKYNAQLSILEELKQNQNLLRFDSNYVKISDIASQFYCEKKVELTYMQGDVDSEEKLLGREGQAEIAQELAEITLQRGWELMFSAHQFSVSEFLFFAKYNDLYLVFRPDRVLFVDGVPRLLVEFKFSKYSRPFISHHVQLQAEGILLEKLGFDVSSLYYLIVIAPIHADRDSKFLSDVPIKIFDKITPNTAEVHEKFRDISAHLYKFNKNTAKKNVNWALEYWKQERVAQLTKNKNKCRRCAYKNSCE